MNRDLLTVTLALALPILTTGCGDAEDTGSGSGGSADTTDEDCWPYCEETASSIAPEDETSLGVSGSAVVDPLPEASSATLAWSNDAETALEWGVAVDAGSLRFVATEAVYPTCESGDSPAIGVDCPDYVAVEGTLSMTAADGSLDVALPVTFAIDEYSVDLGTVSFSTDVEEAELGAGFVLSEYVDSSAYDALSLHLYGEVSTAGELSMSLQAQGSGSDGNVSWAEVVDIATVGGGVF